MKLYTIGLTIAGIATGLSCASSNTSTPQEERVVVSKNGTPVERAEPKHGQDGRGTQSRGTQIPGPTIPKDAQWTILCATITGADQAGQARAARANLIN